MVAPWLGGNICKVYWGSLGSKDRGLCSAQLCQLYRQERLSKFCFSCLQNKEFGLDDLFRSFQSVNTHNAVCFSTTTLPPSLLRKQALRGGSHLILKLHWQMMYCFPQVRRGKLRSLQITSWALHHQGHENGKGEWNWSWGVFTPTLLSWHHLPFKNKYQIGNYIPRLATSGSFIFLRCLGQWRYFRD